MSDTNAADRLLLDFERAMDALFTDYDFRHRQPDPAEDAEAERYGELIHLPSKPMGGSDHD